MDDFLIYAGIGFVAGLIIIWAITSFRLRNWFKRITRIYEEKNGLAYQRREKWKRINGIK